MTATLRVVLDQLETVADDDQASAALELARGLVAGAPSGCEVEGLTPALRGGTDATESVDGLASSRALGLARRELAAAWQMGVTAGAGGGMIHSATLMAPLVRHDRVHDHDQTVVTVWDLRAWDGADALPRATVGWQRAMLKRAARFADAIVAPTHSLAERLAELSGAGDRIRVIGGAAPDGFSTPQDAPGRLRELLLPVPFVVVAAITREGIERGLSAAAAALRGQPDVNVVVIGAAPGTEPMVADLAAGAGIPERRIHVRGRLDDRDRAAVLGSARVVVASDDVAAYPWRALDALALSAPVVAFDSPVHREILLDGAVLVTDADDFAAAVTSVVDDESQADRLRILAADRARAYSWREAAERVWQLHAEL
jgi:glycosyltransferase involved in cell wall biosynthesis